MVPRLEPRFKLERGHSTELPISRRVSFRLPIWMGEGRSQRAIFVPMRAVGEGDDLWRVEVVSWTLEPEAHRVQELLNAVAGRHSDERCG